MQQRLDLCTNAVKLLKDNSSLTPLAAAGAAYDEAISDHDPDEDQEPIVSFVQAQVSAWMEVKEICLESAQKPYPAHVVLPCSKPDQLDVLMSDIHICQGHRC